MVFGTMPLYTIFLSHLINFKPQQPQVDRLTAENFVAEAWSLLAIALVMIGLRIYARLLMNGYRKLKADDALMILAGLLYTAETVAAYIVGAYWQGLANNNITDEQRASLDPHSEEWRLRVNGSKTQLLGWLVYTVLLWTLKSCWTIYYSRLTEGIKNMPARIRIGYVVLLVTFLATFFAILFGCFPVQKHWQIYPDPGPHCYPANSIIQVAVLISLNISTDLYLTSIPLPMIWKSRLPIKKKMVLLGMFGGGFLVMVFGILRCTIILRSGAQGPEEAGQWSCRESFAAVIVGNMPMVYPLLQRWFHRLQDSSRTAVSSASNNLQRSSRIASSVKSKTKSSGGNKMKRFLHPLSIPNDTAWGSDEAIVTTAAAADSRGLSTIPSEEIPPSVSTKDTDKRGGLGSSAVIRSQTSSPEPVRERRKQ
ncbi:hypothetical protein VTN77DRAFT_4770 [Rasamsonia byssochlamydoides]|uniref:uncharacterized protein n=1 Tax=Rasamsonia byssochlamydoides TaxID=89139 RepID=UPI0037420483